MPWSWFAGLRKLGMTRLEATLAALFVHSIHSWRKFGLELDAFQEYGIFTQAYGMAIFPLAGDFYFLEQLVAIFVVLLERQLWDLTVLSTESGQFPPREQFPPKLPHT